MMTKKIVCELNCNEESENQTLVQVMKWRPKMEGRTNNEIQYMNDIHLLEK